MVLFSLQFGGSDDMNCFESIPLRRRDFEHGCTHLYFLSVTFSLLGYLRMFP